VYSWALFWIDFSKTAQPAYDRAQQSLNAFQCLTAPINDFGSSVQSYAAMKTSGTFAAYIP